MTDLPEPIRIRSIEKVMPVDRDIAGAWQTTPDSLAEATLDGVLRYASTHQDPEDPEATRIGIRLHPPGWRAIMRTIAHEHRISYSRLTYYSLGHGIAVLDAQGLIAALRRAYDTTMKSAMERGDPSSLARLNATGNYEFLRTQAFKTTLTVSRETDARISDLAMVCGIPTSRLAVLVNLVSLLTLPDRRNYQLGFREEVAAFYRFAALREEVLLLGDGSTRKKSRLNGELHD